MRYYLTSVAVAALALGTATAQNATQNQNAPRHDTLTSAAQAAGIVEMDGRTMDELAQAPAPTRTTSDDGDASANTGLDGSLDGAEPLARDAVLAEAADTFETADTDGDDALTEAEFVAALEPEAAPVTEGTITEGPDTEGNVEVADAETQAETQAETGTEDGALTERLATKFAAIAGEDGSLSADEMEAATIADFEAADTDDDDALSGEEARTFASLKTGRTAS